MATSGHRRLVDSTMICETSHGSSWPLSVKTRTPSYPASSLARPNSCSSRMHVLGCAWAERGQVEKIFKSWSRAGISTLEGRLWNVQSTHRKLQTMIVGGFDLCSIRLMTWRASGLDFGWQDLSRKNTRKHLGRRGAEAP